MSSAAPPRGIAVIAAILIALALVALYANVQKSRHDKIERAITKPIGTPTPSASP